MHEQSPMEYIDHRMTLKGKRKVHRLFVLSRDYRSRFEDLRLVIEQILHTEMRESVRSLSMENSYGKLCSYLLNLIFSICG